MADETVSSRPTSSHMDNNDGYLRAQKSKFRFKSPKRRSEHEKEHSRNRHHHHHHRSKRRKTSEPPDNPTSYDGVDPPNTSTDPALDPDVAFRESLFDAMADDEGAAFWEGVYGQPIPKISPVKPGPTGELEAMTEDEYAAYVRAEMYKKTHQYLLEEKAQREQAKRDRERLAEEARREAVEADRFRNMVEESLRRGQERKNAAQRSFEWTRKWREYEQLWDELGNPAKSATAMIPWPILGGSQEDINKGEIEAFFLNGPTAGKPDQADLLKVLKVERVRWHPDKMQQKLGGRGIDEVKMRAVTGVFQIIDQMWTELRDKKT